MFSNPYMLYLELIIHTITIKTGRSESIHVPIGRTEVIYKTFSYFGAHIWNHISNNISTNVSYSSVKHLLKFYIQNNSHVIYRLNIYQIVSKQLNTKNLFIR